MQTRVLRRLHPRGTTGRFGAFEVTVFNAVVWPGIDRLGRSERARERRRPTVYALLDQPQAAWIFKTLPPDLRVPAEALARSFRASRRLGVFPLDQPQRIPFGAVFTHELWPAVDTRGGSFRPPAPPTRLRLDQPVSGFRFGATYSHELWPGVEQRAVRTPARSSRWIVDPIDVGWIFPILGAFDPITARGALDLLVASFRVDARPRWRVVDQPTFTQDFSFDAQFTTASLHELATSYRVGARPSWFVAGWPHDAWIHQVFIARAARAAFDGLTASFRMGPRPSWRVADLPMWSQNIVSTFDATFWPAIAQLLQWERQIRISHVWDARRFPGRKLAGGPESAAQPAFDPTTAWAAYDFLAGSYRTGKRPDARVKDYKFPFGLLDARVVMPAIRFLLEAFQSRKRFQRLISEPYLFLRDFPFDPMFTVASTQGLRASFRSAPRHSWRVWDTPADAWMFSVPSTFELSFLSAIRFLVESYRAEARPDWREGDVADTAWTWQSDPRLLWAAFQSQLDTYRAKPRPTWRVTEPSSDAWLASPFNPALWPAIEPRWVSLDLRRRVWLPTDQPSWTQFDFAFDPRFITAALDALWASYRARARRIWLPTDEPLPAWIFENIPPPPPFDPAVFPWSVLGDWLRQRAGMPRESEHMAEPGFPRPLFPRKPTPRRRRPC